MSDEHLAYSTATKQSDKKSGKKSKNASHGQLLGEGPIKIRYERKGRGGKQATLLTDLPMNKADAKQLMRALQQELACGASLKDGVIVLLGDHREALEDYFYQGKRLLG